MNEQVFKDFVLSTHDMLESLSGLTAEELSQFSSVASQVVDLRDTTQFRVTVDVLSRAEITDARRQLASAISAEKWWDGFITCLQIVAMLARP